MAIIKPCGFIALLKETTKIFSQKVKLLSLITLLNLFLFSIFFLLNTFSTKSLINDLVFKIMNIISATPGTPQIADLLVGIKEDVGIFLGVELGFILIYLFTSLFMRTATIFVSVSFYSGDSLSIKGLISRVAKSWTRLFVTRFYIMLLGLGYTTFFLFLFLIPSLALLDHHPLACISILVVLVLIARAFVLYLSVVWVLGLTVSVLEESRGLEALGKARGLIVGMRLQGFLLNVIIDILVLILSQIPQVLTRLVQSPGLVLVLGLVQLVFVCTLSAFEGVAYTALYIQCKKNHGEEVKLQGSIGYRLLPGEEEIV